MLPRLRVLRHKQHVAAIFAPDLIDELIEARRLCQVHVGVWLHAMPVAARDQQLVPTSGQPFHQPVFFPIAQAIQLHRVDEVAVLREKLLQALLMQLLANLVQIPCG